MRRSWFVVAVLALGCATAPAPEPAPSPAAPPARPSAAERAAFARESGASSDAASGRMDDALAGRTPAPRPGAAKPAAPAPAARPAAPPPAARPAAPPATASEPPTATGGKAPPWVLTERYPGCEGKDWITSIGIGESGSLRERRDSAVAHAREHISSTIRVQITGEWKERVLAKQSESHTGGKDESSESIETTIDNSIRSYTDAVLTRVEVKDAYDDGTSCYVFAALHIPTFVDNLREEIERLQSEAEGARGQAAGARREGDDPRYLGHLTTALASYTDVAMRRQSLNALTEGNRAADDPAIARLLEVQDELAAYATGLGLERAAGHTQKGLFNEPLPGPLVLRATQGGRPVKSLPVRFAFGTGAGRLDETVILTDADGRASCTVYATARTGLRENTVTARVDLEAIAAERAPTLDAALGGRTRTEFLYYLPTPESTRLAFAVHEEFATNLENTDWVVGHSAEGFIADRAKAEGFGLVDPASVPGGKSSLEERVRDLAARDTEGLSYFLLSGEVRLRAEPTATTGPMARFKYYLRAEVSLTLTDLASGKVLGRFDDRTVRYDSKGLSPTSYAHAAEIFFRQKGNFPVVALNALMAVHQVFIEDSRELLKRRVAMEAWAGRSK